MSPINHLPAPHKQTIHFFYSITYIYHYALNLMPASPCSIIWCFDGLVGKSGGKSVSGSAQSTIVCDFEELDGIGWSHVRLSQMDRMRFSIFITTQNALWSKYNKNPIRSYHQTLENQGMWRRLNKLLQTPCHIFIKPFLPSYHQLWTIYHHTNKQSTSFSDTLKTYHHALNLTLYHFWHHVTHSSNKPWHTPAIPVRVTCHQEAERCKYWLIPAPRDHSLNQN